MANVVYHDKVLQHVGVFVQFLDLRGQGRGVGIFYFFSTFPLSISNLLSTRYSHSMLYVIMKSWQQLNIPQQWII